MNMKKFKYILLSAATVFLVSCGDDDLNTDSYIKSNTGNFPQSASDVETMLTSIYATLNSSTAAPVGTYFYVAMAAGDECYGGGGENDLSSQAADHLMKADNTTYDNFWEYRYKGIARANSVIETMSEGGFGYSAFAENAELRNQYKGEALFLRAYFYFELTQLFEKVPLMLNTTDNSRCGQASVDEIYAAIASDLKEASTIMPANPYKSVESGHVTKWAAEALMARVFLFYTGFYEKTTLPLRDGGSVTKDEVKGWINDCANNSGHDLVGDFRDLWTYTNKYTVKDYSYTKDVVGQDGKELDWAGNGNSEEVFAVKFCNYAGWTYTNQMGYCNEYCLYFGLRAGNGVESTFPLGQGWGQCPAAPTLWDDWKTVDDKDIRREATLCDVTSSVEGMSSYTLGADKQMEESGLWQKKFMPITSKQYTEQDDKTGEKKVVWPNTFWGCYESYDKSSNGNIMQGGHYADLCIIRYADVLLMQSELNENAEGMNKVRARAGLAPVAYTVENLRNERRFELAYEGVRWGDMRRYGKDYCIAALNGQNGKQIYNKGVLTVMNNGKYQERYEQTRGFFPIPQKEIELSKSNPAGNEYIQNAGWDSSEATLSSWNF